MKTEIYVDTQKGKDTNNGFSILSPLRSFSAAEFLAMRLVGSVEVRIKTPIHKCQVTYVPFKTKSRRKPKKQAVSHNTAKPERCDAIKTPNNKTID